MELNKGTLQMQLSQYTWGGNNILLGSS